MKNPGQRQNRISRLHLAGTSTMLVAMTVLVFAIITMQSAQAQTFTTLHNFNGTDGGLPTAPLVQGADGNFYGTTPTGGANSASSYCPNGCGTVFKITPGGALTSLYSFCSLANCADGYQSAPPLIQSSNGDFYGTTEFGGAFLPFGYGTVFKITPSGTLTTLHSFDNTAYGPYAGLVQGTNGDFYGTTYGYPVGGTVFKITPGGALSTLYNFCSQTNCTDGGYPVAALVLATNGDFYGTTADGGAYANGTVFKITPSGTLTTLHSFDITDGAGPQGLIQATNGNFYGTTISGGATDNGTVFQITPSGTLTTLYNFCSLTNCTDGTQAFGELTQATDGNLFGTTAYGGNVGLGTIFKITTSGTLTTVYSFCPVINCADGGFPMAGLVQGTNGTLYGSTSAGRTSDCQDYGCGTIFSLSVGLGPFVVLRTTSGKEGVVIGILGQGFNSSSVAKFGGTQATAITRTGATFIKATVPAAALTGAVTVTTGATKLTSSQTFRVTPTITSFSPAGGPVGTPVTITGTGLMQATKVAFNGKSASFTVNSDTQITATVPTGATTGKIMVTTPGGSASSATTFTVN
jgi:uncharacterized repeat protein (TIGR03803 family)